MQKITLVSSHSGVYSLDINTGIVSQTFKDCNASRFGVSYVGNSINYLAGFQANTSILHIWNNKTDPIYRVSLPEIIKCCEFQDDGGVIYAGGLSGTMYIWVISTGQLLNCWLSHYKPINKIKLIQNNSILVTCSDDCYIQAFLISELLESNISLSFPKPLMKWNAHSASINDFFPLGFTNNLSKLSIITVGDDFTLNLLTFSAEKPKSSLNFTTQLYSCTSSECGKLIFIGGGNGLIYKIHYDQTVDANLNCVSKLIGHSGSVINCICSNGKVYSSATDGVRIWDTITGACITQLPQFGDGIVSILSTRVTLSYLSLSIPCFKPFQKNITNSCKVIGINIPAKDRRLEIKNEIYRLSNRTDVVSYLSNSFLSFSCYSQHRKNVNTTKIKDDTLVYQHNNMIKLAIEKCIFLEISKLRSNSGMRSNDINFEFLRRSIIPYSKFREAKYASKDERKKEKQINKGLRSSPKVHYKWVKSCGMNKLARIVYLKMLQRKKYKLYR